MSDLCFRPQEGRMSLVDTLASMMGTRLHQERLNVNELAIPIEVENDVQAAARLTVLRAGTAVGQR